MGGAIGFLLANWRWIGSAAVAAFLSFAVTGAFKGREINRLNATIATMKAKDEHGRAQYWHDAFFALDERRKGERRASDKAVNGLQLTLATAQADADIARAQLEKEKHDHAFDLARRSCVGSYTLRVRIDAASGAAAGSGAGATGGATGAAGGPGAKAPAAAEGPCITGDNAVTGMLNLSEYIGIWGPHYDSLRDWSLDPLDQGAH